MGVVFEQASYTVAVAAVFNNCFAQNVGLSSFILLLADLRYTHRGDVYFAKNTNTRSRTTGMIWNTYKTEIWWFANRLRAWVIPSLRSDPTFCSDQVYWEYRELLIWVGGEGDGAKPHMSPLYKLREWLYETIWSLVRGKYISKLQKSPLRAIPS